MKHLPLISLLFLCLATGCVLDLNQLGDDQYHLELGVASLSDSTGVTLVMDNGNILIPDEKSQNIALDKGKRYQVLYRIQSQPQRDSSYYYARFEELYEVPVLTCANGETSLESLKASDPVDMVSCWLGGGFLNLSLNCLECQAYDATFQMSVDEKNDSCLFLTLVHHDLSQKADRMKMSALLSFLPESGIKFTDYRIIHLKWLSETEEPQQLDIQF